jgi:hypothetical protein
MQLYPSLTVIISLCLLGFAGSYYFANSKMKRRVKQDHNPHLVENKYSRELGSLRQLLSSSRRNRELLSVLRKMENEDIIEIEQTLNIIRKLFEALMDLVCEVQGVPENLDRRAQIDYLSGLKYWRENTKQENPFRTPIFPEYIQHSTLLLWRLSSSASHLNNDRIICTEHTAIGSTHLLLDFINWVSKWKKYS